MSAIQEKTPTTSKINLKLQMPTTRERNTDTNNAKKDTSKRGTKINSTNNVKKGTNH
ncbi:28809_t:CDS:2 [Gigaspora margarita]|uniref:28809_t:CDS:1 n=1 Tax=Gigaspora margarita TaxID=4874 RepID=A0ABN7UGS3_GIGMA|nr:28809_t:CDS:2 [Gigaspora margarita]